MLVRSASSTYSRRRLLGGLAVLGLSAVATGCDRPFPSVQSPLADAPPQRSAPTPLEPVDPPAAPSLAVAATFGRVVNLEGVTIERDTVRAGEYLRVWLHWQSVGPAAEDLRSIGRLVSAEGRVRASEDDQIGGRRRHLTRWQVGERCVDEMRLRVAGGAGPGEYGLVVGVLRPDNQTAVPVTARPKMAESWQEDDVFIGMIEVVTG